MSKGDYESDDIECLQVNDETEQTNEYGSDEEYYQLKDSEILLQASDMMGLIDGDPSAAIKDMLLKGNNLVSIDSVKHIYVNEDMGWVPITSSVAAKKIVSMLKIHAPVNFVLATKPIVDSLTHCIAPTVVLGCTFCIGKVRCQFYYDRTENSNRLSKMILFPARPLNLVEELPHPLLESTARWSYCVCPTTVQCLFSSISIPRVLPSGQNRYLYSWIYSVFGEQTESILWLIGDILADFGNKRIFMLYGPGGVGKTTVVNIISSLSSATVVQIPGRLMAKNSSAPRNYGNSLTPELKSDLASTRLAVIGDVEVTSDDEHLNIQTVKEITGGDIGVHGKISVTGIMSANRLFNYKYMSDYTLPDRTRRLVVIPTVDKRTSKNKHFSEPSLDDKIHVLSLSIAIRSKYDMKPPLTTPSLLMTLFQAKFKEALSIVTVDYSSSSMENYIATRVLCYKFNINEEDMQNCLSSVGSNCCTLFCGLHLIANITTKHGVKLEKEKERASTGSSVVSSSRNRYIKRYSSDVPMSQINF